MGVIWGLYRGYIGFPQTGGLFWEEFLWKGV